MSPHLVSTLSVHYFPFEVALQGAGGAFWRYDYSDHTVARNLEGKSAALPSGKIGRALSVTLSKESIESMDSNDSTLSTRSILSIRSTTPPRDPVDTATAYCHCLLPPVACPPPVPKRPARRPGTSSRYSNRRAYSVSSPMSLSSHVSHSSHHCRKRRSKRVDEACRLRVGLREGLEWVLRAFLVTCTFVPYVPFVPFVPSLSQAQE